MDPQLLAWLVPLASSALLVLAAILAVYSAGEVWDEISHSYVADLADTVSALGIEKEDLPYYLRWWGIALAGSFFFVWFVLGMPPLSFAAAFAVFVAPRFWLEWQIEERRMILRDQLVGSITALANACRAGLSLAQGLDTVAKETPEPLSRELQRIVDDHHRGLPLHRSIQQVKERLNLDSFTLFAAAVLVSLERGGRITDTLDRIARSLQENQRLERKLQADTASGRRVVTLLAMFPIFFLGLFGVVYPEGTAQVFSSLWGQLILLAVAGLVYASWRWSQKILDVAS